MKTHLFRPGEVITMCGIQIKSFSTRDPSLVDCRKCLMSYEANIVWYWEKEAGLVPVGAIWSAVDTPMFFVAALVPWPSLPFSWRPIVKEWELNYRLKPEPNIELGEN